MDDRQPPRTFPPIDESCLEGWVPVYKSQAELDRAMAAFSDAVSDDVRAFAETRRESERLVREMW